MLKLGDNTYRRGLTLGLTMAEIFILILFLMLLLLLALYANNIEDNGIIKTSQKELMPVTNNREVPRIELPDEIKKLVRSHASQQKTITKLEKAREKLPENTKTFIDKINTLEKALATAEQKNAENETQIETTQQENESLRAALHASKGVDPPCWYEVVHKKEVRREKPYYLLDVAVHNEYLLVRINQNIPLSGSAINEIGQPASTSYAEEYEKLPLAHLMAVKSRKFSLAEFEEIAKPIKRMGKNEQIRDYACVFYAKIWDYTSATAKKRWKRARETIEDSFYPVLVRNDPWE